MELDLGTELGLGSIMVMGTKLGLGSWMRTWLGMRTWHATGMASDTGRLITAARICWRWSIERTSVDSTPSIYRIDRSPDQHVT